MTVGNFKQDISTALLNRKENSISKTLMGTLFQNTLTPFVTYNKPLKHSQKVVILPFE